MKTFRFCFLLMAVLSVGLFSGCSFSDVNGGEVAPNESGVSDADPSIFQSEGTAEAPVAPEKPAEPTPATSVSIPATIAAASPEPIKIEVRLPQLDEPRFQSVAPQVSLKTDGEKPRQKMGAPRPICLVYSRGYYDPQFGWQPEQRISVPESFPVELRYADYPDAFEQQCGFTRRVSPTFHWATPRGYGQAYQGWYGPDHFQEMYFKSVDQPYASPKPGSEPKVEPAKPEEKSSAFLPSQSACANGACKVQRKGKRK